MAKSWSLAWANLAVALATIACIFLTGSVWSLVGLLAVPANLAVWQYTREGVMIVTFEEDDDIEVSGGNDDRLEIRVDPLGKTSDKQ